MTSQLYNFKSKCYNYLQLGTLGTQFYKGLHNHKPDTLFIQFMRAWLAAYLSAAHL